MGMSGTHLTWGEPFLEALRKDFEVVIYDHRGMGRSGRTQPPFTIADLADDADALREVLAYWHERRPVPPGTRRCVVCGEPFAARPAPGRKPLYCGSACRNRAFRERNGKGAAGGQV